MSGDVMGDVWNGVEMSDDVVRDVRSGVDMSEIVVNNIDDNINDEIDIYGHEDIEFGVQNNDDDDVNDKILNNFYDIDVDLNYDFGFLNSLSNYYSTIEFNNLICHKSDIHYVNVIHLNCRSFAAHLNDISLFIYGMRILPAIIALSETWFTNNEINNSTHIQFPEYIFVCNNRINKKGGGTGFLINRTIIYSNLHNSILYSSDFFEWSGITTNINGNKHYFLCVYKPPDANINEFILSLSDFLFNTLKPACKSKLYILGDFNINLAVNNAYSRNFINSMAGLGLFFLINQPTRITDSSSTVIDNILTNDNCSLIKGIICEDITDHMPIFVCIPHKNNKCNNKCSKRPLIHTRLTDEKNIQEANSMLSGIKWPELQDSIVLNIDYDNFFRIYMNCIDVACPMISRKLDLTEKIETVNSIDKFFVEMGQRLIDGSTNADYVSPSSACYPAFQMTNNKLFDNYSIKIGVSDRDKVIGIVYKARDKLDCGTKLMLYYSFIYPYLIYGNIFWGSTFKFWINKVFIAQKYFVRICFGLSKYDHTSYEK
ncbi:hypothetical protein HELRODRAFT_163815 [Helobdella robusta]|uniref:Endonuclease/exonuclease/phosphatase domain-containing protein n=1 Tax=Helobdella robusta TaxID=6412 RepID=T1EUI2_HELRO|nr:hypothetical protein HELRODRAFT_163815 [Helobdella robusta]ESN96718.1 hypothetical protein HELRODRAFT_163815 [Helobdella robusta]